MLFIVIAYNALAWGLYAASAMDIGFAISTSAIMLVFQQLCYINDALLNK